MSQMDLKPRPEITDELMFRSAYSPRKRVSITFPEQSKHTKQEFKEECDINNIMAQYLINGILPNMNERAPQYLDVTGYDYQQSMDLIAGAQTLFNELPSGVRLRFENDPAQFLDFCSDEKNRSEMAEMGLLRPKQEWVIPYPTSESKFDEIGNARSPEPITPNNLNQPPKNTVPNSPQVTST